MVIVKIGEMVFFIEVFSELVLLIDGFCLEDVKEFVIMVED